MKDNFRFMQDIWIFDEEDKGFAYGKSPGGYFKIEIREGKGKIYAMVQNLMEPRSKGKYDLYLIKIHSQDNCNVKIGTIIVNKGRGELVWNFDPLDVDGSGKTITEFNGAIILYNDEKNHDGIYKCPMAAYSKGRVKWSDAFSESLKPAESLRPVELKDPVELNDQVKLNNPAELPKLISSLKPIQSFDLAKTVETIDIDDICEVIETINKDNVIYNDDMDCTKEGYTRDDKDSIDDSDDKDSIDDSDDKDSLDARDDENDKTEESIDSINNISRQIPYAKKKMKPDIIRLIKLLDKEFKRGDPFNSRRRDYKWWNINSPVNLINILEACNINVPRFFSPSVVMSYFKYRYLVAGVYISMRRGKEYFVCAIPGTYDVDESPFGDLCRWVQVERNKEYGAFGYWVTYIDPYTGELLKFN